MMTYDGSSQQEMEDGKQQITKEPLRTTKNLEQASGALRHLVKLKKCVRFVLCSYGRIIANGMCMFDV